MKANLFSSLEKKKIFFKEVMKSLESMKNYVNLQTSNIPALEK